ncbi:tRNA-splicing endonuclease subunit Sen54 isoform X2 [Pseudoliparis swirei]|uniref:tRNA-splicing endonuclease subunit Sen54 isoform X2 n=1 Tax=Pseudoliparis swirei TaxID=2059687 RepID=UPI0024BE3970|nr:tRNA-splicing endonuclease subunit Sen54 isoform X2 [Pseudoliparis swirei]
MADQNKKDIDQKFYNEILTPSELFAARSRSHKIPVRGQKDFFPDGSDEQRRRLEQSLNEHWGLLSEERVEKIGNLVKATWSPTERVVELQTPAGKFWQTMGFSASGKQRLLPEEALHLMECGSLQVSLHQLPLSIQDGYEKFLSPGGGVSLLQYQVFGHLKRLGYVVHRFQPSAQPSSYARQLNLTQSLDTAGKRVKRKRSDSPSTTSSHTEAQEEESEEDIKPTPLPVETPPETPGAQSAGGGGTWWLTDDPVVQSDPRPASGSSRRDFVSVLFPDLGSGGRLSGPLAPPDPSLLPGCLAVGVCDLASWRRRLNQRYVRTSPEERRRMRLTRLTRRYDGIKDREVRRCRNWAEYQELLETRRGRSRHGRPAHLWSRKVAPLHDPERPIPTAKLLEKISVIESTDLLEGASRLEDAGGWRICFNVYQPDSVADFKKSDPGKPYARVCSCSFSGAVPDLRAIKLLSFQSAGVPVVFGVVDHGDVSFYTFKGFQLPTDVFP